MLFLPRPQEPAVGRAASRTEFGRGGIFFPSLAYLDLSPSSVRALSPPPLSPPPPPPPLSPHLLGILHRRRRTSFMQCSLSSSSFCARVHCYSNPLLSLSLHYPFFPRLSAGQVPIGQDCEPPPYVPPKRVCALAVCAFCVLLQLVLCQHGLLLLLRTASHERTAGGPQPH